MIFGIISFLASMLFIGPMLAIPENRTPFFIIGSIISASIWLLWVFLFWLPYNLRRAKVKSANPKFSELDIYTMMFDTKEGKRYSVIGTIGAIMMMLILFALFVFSFWVSDGAERGKILRGVGYFVVVVLAVISVIALVYYTIYFFRNFTSIRYKIQDHFKAFRVKKLTDRQKIFLCMAGAAVLLLAVAIATTVAGTRIPYGFFVFLRIVTCGALVGLMLEKLPIWAKFALLLLAILYNPIVPIHLGDREVWAWINACTIPALAAPWVVIWKRLRKI